MTRKDHGVKLVQPNEDHPTGMTTRSLFFANPLTLLTRKLKRDRCGRVLVLAGVEKLEFDPEGGPVNLFHVQVEDAAHPRRRDLANAPLLEVVLELILQRVFKALFVHLSTP